MYLPLWQVLSSKLISMQTMSNGVALREVFICSKLEQNLSKMEVRTFVRLQQVIWDQSLVFEAEFILSKATHCNIFCLLCCSALFFCSVPRPFFHLIQLTKVWKRYSHLSLSSQAIILEFFWYSFCKVWTLCDFVIRDFCWPWRYKYQTWKGQKSD